MGELINHYYAGGPSYTYRSFFWEIPNYDNQSQDKCLSRADATERYSDSVGKLENLYQVKEDCMEEIKIYSPVEYINPEAYRIVTYKELELIPVITKVRLAIRFNLASDINEPKLLVLNYNAKYNRGYFVPESFNINTDVMSNYIYQNNGYAIYNNNENNSRLIPSDFGTHYTVGDNVFGYFYNNSNELITTDNKYFPIFEINGDMNFGGIISKEFNDVTELMSYINGRSIVLQQNFLLMNHNNVNTTTEKMSIYNTYFSKIGSYNLSVIFQTTFNDIKSATITVNRDTSLTYNVTSTISYMQNENGEKVQQIFFECKMPKISFMLS